MGVQVVGEHLAPDPTVEVQDRVGGAVEGRIGTVRDVGHGDESCTPDTGATAAKRCDITQAIVEVMNAPWDSPVA